MALREYDYENVPTVSIVKKILTDAIKMEATDIHFDPTADELIIKFRINGDLKEYTIAPENVKANIITRIKILAGMNITDSLLPGTGAISFEFNNKTHNMSVSSLPIVDGEKIVVHISNYAKNIKNLHNIGFTEANTNKIKSLLNEQQGMILITGNTNAGKSTTLYTLLKELNNSSNNIISIENPVKMHIKGINQVNIAPEKGLTYRNVIKSVMLQDPNIIAINELVDDETTRSALRASVSGRLVISTMHTKTAYQTIDTLLHRDIENYLLGSNLIGIISQRLVKKLCPSCRKLRRATPYEASIFKEILGIDVTEIYSSNGCIECNNGYIDQIPVEEVIEIDEELRNAISNNRNRDLIKNIIYEENDSIIKNGLKKVLEGKTSFEEIMRIIDLRVDFSENESKIKNIILGNSLPPEEPISITKREKIEESKKNVEEEAVEEKQKEITSPIKVELENVKELQEKNITNLKVSENELKNILNQIEENASLVNEEKGENKKEDDSLSKDIEPQAREEVERNIEESDSKKNAQVTSNESQPISEIPLEESKEPPKENPLNNEQEKNELQNTNKEINIEPSENISTEDKEVTSSKENENEIEIEEVKEDTIEQPNVESTPTEETTEFKENTEEPTQPNSPSPTNENKEPEPAPINFDDDDENDDDFNYGDSYINNF